MEVGGFAAGSVLMQDTRITGAGAVGMWTKADSVTAFDDFAFGSIAVK